MIDMYGLAAVHFSEQRRLETERRRRTYEEAWPVATEPGTIARAWATARCVIQRLGDRYGTTGAPDHSAPTASASS